MIYANSNDILEFSDQRVLIKMFVACYSNHTSGIPNNILLDSYPLNLTFLLNSSHVLSTCDNFNNLDFSLTLIV